MVRGGVEPPTFRFHAERTIRHVVACIPKITLMADNVPMNAASWWCLAGAPTVLGGLLLLRAVTMLSAANEGVRLPWVAGRAGQARIVALEVLAGVSTSLGMNFGAEALGRRHLYDVLWDVPFIVVFLVIAFSLQIQHNRHVRRGIYVGARPERRCQE